MSYTLSQARENNPGQGGPPLLHGSDVPKGKQSIQIKVKGVRQPPKGFNAFVILDIEPMFNKGAWAVNKSNAVALSGGEDDFDFEDLVGKKITLYVVAVNNPKTNKPCKSLSVVEPE